MNENIKIFGVGLNKTGTTTLDVALRELGYTKGITWINHHMMDIYDNGDVDFFLSMSEKYTFFDDIPWALLYKELHKKYPEAYFILTTRKDSQTWYKSHCKHILVDANISYPNNILYGAPDPRLARKKFISYYEKHNNEVRTYFKDNPNFIEVCWGKGDEWTQLCHLLKKEIPKKDFPYYNRLISKRKTLKEHISSYFKKKEEIRIKNSNHRNKLVRVEEVEVSNKTVLIKGFYLNENGYNDLHKQKLILKDGILSITPTSIELIDSPHFNKLFPYLQNGEKIGFLVKFTFSKEISKSCELTICVNDKNYNLFDIIL